MLQVILFILIGCAWIIFGLSFGWHWLVAHGSRDLVHDRRQLVWSSLYANRKQAVISFLTLTLGVFIVFAVGLNRKGFGDTSQLMSGTGGYSLWMETTVPVYYDLNSDEGRRQLSLRDLPDDAVFLQFLRYTADDASCLNLNKVSTPTVLGVDMNEFTKSFNITPSHSVNLHSSIFNVYVDETVLTWGLMKNLGDTLYYQNSHGEEVKLILAGTLPNTVLQGNVVMDKDQFAKIWPEITGSEVALVKVKENEIEQTRNILATALNEYGVRVMPTGERLRQFYQVTDTYLTIFLTLGGIGLLIGIFSFVIIIRKNLVMKEKDVRLYNMLGYPSEAVEYLLVNEHVMVPLYAIFIGITGAILSAGAGISDITMNTWLLCLVFTALLLGFALFYVKTIINNQINKQYED